MKTSTRIKRQAELALSKIEFITRHIRNVEDNCLLLGKKLIELGFIDLGVILLLIDIFMMQVNFMVLNMNIYR